MGGSLERLPETISAAHSEPPSWLGVSPSLMHRQLPLGNDLKGSKKQSIPWEWPPSLSSMLTYLPQAFQDPRSQAESLPRTQSPGSALRTATQPSLNLPNTHSASLPPQAQSVAQNPLG